MAAPRFRLRVLGPVVVEALGSDAPASSITQPRHLALLCFLALARPRGLQSRDAILELLWPGHDQARGRRAIRNALYALRRELGADAIVSVGENLVGVDPAVLACDAIQLERHGAEGGERSSHALAALHPEPFHGLHVEAAHPFDGWLSAERARLRQLQTELSGRPRVPRTEQLSSTMRRPHSVDAAAMYARGHYLFLRSAHGGAAADLLLCRDYFERSRALDPSFAPAMAGLANFYAVAARRGVLTPFHDTFAHAIRCARDAQAMDATLAIPHVHFGVKALYLDDDWELAEREFATAVAKDPEYAEGQRFYAVWLGLAGRHVEALHHMEIGARLEPDIPHILSSLGAARLAAGDCAGAEAALRHTLTLDPRHAPARARLVQLLEEAERFEEAVRARHAGGDPQALTYETALREDGADGYRRRLHETRCEEAQLLEARLVERQEQSVQDLFDPPIVRLVRMYVAIGEHVRARAWQLQAVAARPALARWFASILPSEGRGAAASRGPSR